MLMKPNVVLIGGGTGSFTLLQELKNWTPNITAIVNMCDDGGSSGELRDELGVLPPGDIRQCLVALSNRAEVRDLFTYRFSRGKLDGHAVGNIILSALELQTGSFTKAVKIVADFMQITGQVIPVTAENHVLVMQDGSRFIRGEHRISQHEIHHPDKAKIFLEPKAHLNSQATKAIMEADMVVIAPGNLYSSLLPALSIAGMPHALKSTQAKIVMVANLINKPLHTYRWHVVDYVQQMEQYIGRDTIDYVLYNTKILDKKLLEKYAKDKEYPVLTDKERFQDINATTIGTHLIANKIFKQDLHDSIQRTLIRHDASAVRKHLEKLLSGWRD